MQRNFTINCDFYLFLVFFALLEVARKLQFLNEYGELKTFSQGIGRKPLLKQWGKLRG